jgi:NitT/TauT family transport system ATP-binding protein
MLNKPLMPARLSGQSNNSKAAALKIIGLCMYKAIEIKNLTKKFSRNKTGAEGEVTALDNISLKIDSGEFVSVFGPNGSGKTTMLMCVSGVIKPSSGSILINGLAPKNTMTGFVFQNYREALLPWRTCLSNIAFPLEIAGVKKRTRLDTARQMVNDLDLNIDLDSYPYQQSGGQQQLVAIARALVSNPDVLVMDEPLSALDVKTRVRMRRIIENIWLKTKITTLHVSHDEDEAIFLSDRIVILSDRPGKIEKVIENRLPRPRHTIIGSREYNELRNVMLHIYEQNGGHCE